jgi:hypothetical protein
MKILLSILFLWLLSIPLFGGNIDSSSLATASSDSLHQLLSYYDSLSPDSQILDSTIGDSTFLSTEDSLPVSQELQAPIENTRLHGLDLNQRQKPWVFAVLLLISLLIGITRFINPQVHSELLSAVLKLKNNNDDDSPGGGVKSLILSLFFIIHCAVLALLVFGFTNYDILFTFDQSILDYSILLTIFLIAYLLKFFAYKFTSDALVIPSFSSENIAFLASLGYVFSLLALPAFALKYYNHYDWIQTYSLWYFYGLIGLYFLFRSIKLVLLSYRNFSFNKIYLFIYLCAVEILPAVLILYALLNFS